MSAYVERIFILTRWEVYKLQHTRFSGREEGCKLQDTVKGPHFRIVEFFKMRYCTGRRRISPTKYRLVLFNRLTKLGTAGIVRGLVTPYGLLVEVMACCLTASIHYLSCQIISEVLWHSPEIFVMSLNIIILRLYQHLPGTSELTGRCPIHSSLVLNREWRWSWSSADRWWYTKYIWVINNFISY